MSLCRIFSDTHPVWYVLLEFGMDFVSVELMASKDLILDFETK